MAETNAPPPPPNAHAYNSSEGLMRAMIEWIWSFYTRTILEGYLATQSALENASVALVELIDPATATAATAQQTANNALTLATANDARLDGHDAELLDIKAGSVTISGVSTSGVWTFTDAFSAATYKITATPVADTGTPAAGSKDVDSIDKTASDATLRIATAPGGGNSVTFDLIAIKKP